MYITRQYELAELSHMFVLAGASLCEDCYECRCVVSTSADTPGSNTNIILNIMVASINTSDAFLQGTSLGVQYTQQAWNIIISIQLVIIILNK